MTDETKTDYQDRLESLSEAESKEWFRATEGKHSIKFLNEGVPFTQEWEGEDVKKLMFDVEIKGKEYSFSVTEGQTKQSLYGQILLIATKSEPVNTLSNKTITLLVTGEGKKKRYTILEAVGLEKEEVEEVEVK